MTFITQSPAAQNTLLLLSRILMAALFLPAGMGKLTGFQDTVGYISSIGLPLPIAGAVLAIAIEIIAGLAILLGYKTRLAALVLALFTLAASVLFHPYWAAAPDQAFVAQLLFFKNIALIGGLLAIAAHGAGRWSLDFKTASLA